MKCNLNLSNSKIEVASRRPVGFVLLNPSFSAEDFEVILGEHSLSTTTESSITKTFNIDLIVYPDNFVSVIYGNDFALVRLTEEADITTFNPICLPDINQDFTGKLATVIGWGLLRENDYNNPPDELQKLFGLKIITDEACQTAFDTYSEWKYTITGDMMCAGGEKGKDGCNVSIFSLIIHDI